MMTDPLTFAAAITAVVAAVTALIVAVRKTASEVAHIAGETSTGLSRRLQELENAIDLERTARRTLESELAEVKQQLSQVRFELTVYQAGTQLLIDQVEAAGMSAAWHPPA